MILVEKLHIMEQKINALTFNTTYDDILGDEENNQIYYKLYNTL